MIKISNENIDKASAPGARTSLLWRRDAPVEGIVCFLLGCRSSIVKRYSLCKYCIKPLVDVFAFIGLGSRAVDGAREAEAAIHSLTLWQCGGRQRMVFIWTPVREGGTRLT